MAALEELLKAHLAIGSVSQGLQCAKDAARVYETLGDLQGQVKSWLLASQLGLRHLEKWWRDADVVYHDLHLNLQH